MCLTVISALQIYNNDDNDQLLGSENPREVIRLIQECVMGPLAALMVGSKSPA